MIDKEIGELRRHLRRDRSNITAIFGCFVNDNKEIICQFRQSTGMMPVSYTHLTLPTIA